MAAKRCKNCKWWSTRTAHRPGWGTCDLTESGTQGTAPKDSLAEASSGDGYFGVLYTAPDFGCAQWEVR